MRKMLLIAFLVMMGLTAVWSQGKDPLQQVVERGLNRAAAQSRILAEALKELPGARKKGPDEVTIGYEVIK